MSDIKVVNSGPDTIKVSINETPKVNVSSPDVSVVKVSAAASGSSSGSSTFLGLSDTPATFTASKFLKVNSDGDAVEFVDSAGGASALNELSDATTTGGSTGVVLVRNSSGNYTTSQDLQEIRSLLKTNTGTTTLTGDGSGTSTDDGRLELTSTAGKVKFATNSEMELTSTTAKLKTGVTELKLTETSPGDIEFVVATDASGSTAFTAVHVDGSTSANQAEFNVKNGTTLKIHGASGSAALRYSGSGANVSLPSAGGTLLANVSEDGSPQLGANLDVQDSSLFTSTVNGDVQLTPNGTGSVNLDGTVKFKRFSTPPAAFEGGMYADNADNLYFGVS